MRMCGTGFCTDGILSRGGLGFQACGRCSAVLEWFDLRRNEMEARDARSGVVVALTLILGLTLFVSPAYAERTLEWRDDGLWVVDDGEEVYFEALSDVDWAGWAPRVAGLSPDGELVAYVRHTGGGFENEGQSCYLARWDGMGERLLLETDWLIPALYWLEGNGTFYVAVQQMSGGTSYRSHFAVVDAVNGDILAMVEGRIYGTGTWGARFVPGNIDSAVGLRYEVLGRDETPTGCGVFYVDELMSFPVSGEFVSVNGEDPSEHSATDGEAVTAWLAPSDQTPSIEIELAPDSNISGLWIQSGWQWHQMPGPDEYAWSGIDWYPLYDRPKEVLVTFPDGTTSPVELGDTRSIQWIAFDAAIGSGTVTLTVLSVYRGLEFDQVAISEIFTRQSFPTQ